MSRDEWDNRRDGDERKISFRNRLFNISYEPKNRKDISKTGVQYKRKIRGKVEEHI